MLDVFLAETSGFEPPSRVICDCSLSRGMHSTSLPHLQWQIRKESNSEWRFWGPPVGPPARTYNTFVKTNKTYILYFLTNSAPYTGFAPAKLNRTQRFSRPLPHSPDIRHSADCRIRTHVPL